MATGIEMPVISEIPPVICIFSSAISAIWRWCGDWTDAARKCVW